MNYSKMMSLVLVVLSLLSFNSFPLSQAQPNNSSCKVEIVGGMPNMYPGQLARLEARVSGADPLNYTWQVEGPIIKDYDDDVLGGAYKVEEPTPMSSSDFQNSDISFYWKPNTTDTSRNVSITIQTEDGSCQASQNYVVAMGNDRYKQAEDFFVEENHTGSFSGVNNRTTTNILFQHLVWHLFFNFASPSYNDNGDTFFDFHNLYLNHFNRWRSEFGYPPIAAWDPGTDLPPYVNASHPYRAAVYNKMPLPDYFKIYPNGDGPTDRLSNGNPCEIADAPVPPWPSTEDALNDFDPDLDLLGCAFTDPYHNDVHGAVGGETGDMNNPRDAPRDPIFWSWHKFANDTAAARISLNQSQVLKNALSIGDKTSGLGVVGNVSSVADTVPPRVIHQNPFRIYPFITEERLLSVGEEEGSIENGTNTPAISVTFNEPVLHITANDFIVNQSPATFVNGTGQGPYLFRGFEIPKPGAVNVTLLLGNISDTNGNQFEGASWNYTMIDPDKNNDMDGASDKLEVNFFRTNPLVPDTDGDNIPDGVEVSFPCLEPLANDAVIMDIANNVINETGSDSDSDGKTDVEEFVSQTDPCSMPQSTEIDTAVAGIRAEQPSLDITLNKPFALVIKRSGGITGDDSSLSYDSFTKRAVSNINGKEITRQISNADENMVKQILNNSGFFDANSFYPPAPNSTDYQEFTLIATLDGKLHATYWTEASEAVTEGIQNLPYIISYTLGTGSIF